MLVENEAIPCAFNGAVWIVVPPSYNVTVPVGIPVELVTVAVKLTNIPASAVVADWVTLTVVGVFCTCCARGVELLVA